MQNPSRITRRSQVLPLAAMGCIVSLVIHGAACGQDKWEFLPYRVTAGIAAHDRTEFSDAELRQLESHLSELASAHLGAAWQFSVAPPSDELRSEMAVRFEQLTAADIISLQAEAADSDKQMLVTIDHTGVGVVVRVRELDVTTRMLGPVAARTSPGRQQLASDLLLAIVDAFSPLVKLERANGNALVGQLRAAALTDDSSSPIYVKPGDPLLPVVRIDDRLGRSAGDHVSLLPLTVLNVVSREGVSVNCEIHSAARHRLGARANLRLSRYGLAVRCPQSGTRVVLRADDDSAAPLVDYELIESSDAAGGLRVVARTDALGAAEIPADDRPWRIMYVRHGENLLARIPLVVGFERQLVIPLPSNDMRLRAQGFVAALTQEVVDTVARRQILAARLRQRIAAAEYDEAQAVLDELQRLTGSRQFEERLRQSRKNFTGDSARSQQHIDALFQETRASLARYLDQSEIERLETQLAQARQQR